MKVMIRMLAAVLGFIAALLGAIATVPAAATAQATETTQAGGKSLIPAGYGTLKQDEFTIQLRSGPLLIKVTPLAETVIRTGAPDTYERLHALAESRRREAQSRSGSAEPELFLVSFFSYQADVPFQPEDLQLIHQGRPMRATILPITPGWGAQLLKQQDLQTAIYAFPDAIDYEIPLVVQYGTVQNEAWSQVIPRLQTERNKILSRAGQQPRDGEQSEEGGH